MMQSTKRPLGNPPTTLSADPIAATMGYAAVFDGFPDALLANPGRRSSPTFVPSCPYAKPATPQDAAPGDAAEIAGPPPRAGGWLANAWSWYRDWRERRRISAAWEALDERTLRDIGASCDAMEDGERPASRWERCNTVL